MCYPGVLESLSQRFEASLYVIPSSIHECMVIPDYDVFPEECLSDMVRDVNEKTVKPQETCRIISYYYHWRKSGELTRGVRNVSSVGEQSANNLPENGGWVENTLTIAGVCGKTIIV